MDIIHGDPIFPVFTIGNNYLYWCHYLESQYCSSLVDTNENCTLCSQNCAYGSLGYRDSCADCNSSSCGYSNLACLQKDSCYYYMLGDANCNLWCKNNLECAADLPSRNNIIIILICVLVIITIS